MKRSLMLGVLGAWVTAPLWAGVVFEVETTDHGASPPRVETHQMSAEGRMLKMEIDSGGRGKHGDVIFRGDRREMVIVDHDEKSVFVMDEQTLRELAAQIGSAMSQIEEALKNVPESQRAMVEEMMKKRMPQQNATKTPAVEVRKTGDRADQAGYPCVKYEIVTDGSVTSELWVTDWDSVEGGEEAVGAFRDMANFASEMVKALASAGGPLVSMTGLDGSGVAQWSQIEGFPVVTRQLDNGRLESESVLRGSERRALDPSDFEPPAGYKRQQMGPR